MARINRISLANCAGDSRCCFPDDRDGGRRLHPQGHGEIVINSSSRIDCRSSHINSHISVAGEAKGIAEQARHPGSVNDRSVEIVDARVVCRRSVLLVEGPVCVETRVWRGEQSVNHPSSNDMVVNSKTENAFNQPTIVQRRRGHAVCKNHQEQCMPTMEHTRPRRDSPRVRPETEEEDG